MKGRTKQRKMSARFGRTPTISLQIIVNMAGFIESLSTASRALHEALLKGGLT